MSRRLLRDEDHLRSVLEIPFSAEQMAAIVAPHDRPGVIIAGAGSGKTTVMAARVVWLVGHEGVPPEAILGLTFTNKAATELSARVRDSLRLLSDSAGRDVVVEDAGQPSVSTYHAYAGTLITEYGLLLGFEPDVALTADASRFQRAARALASYGGSLALTSTSMPHLIGDVLRLDSQMAEHLVHPVGVWRFDEEFRAEVRAATQDAKQIKLFGELCDTAAKRDELVTLVERYREAKAAAGVMDFSDQMERGARLAIEVPQVGAAQRERYQVVLLDEYQDTSVAQRDLLRGLFSGPDGADGLGHCVTAVGDPCQAIYGWRGAAADNLTGFLDDFPPSADAALESCGRGAAYSLRVNRRSGADILDVANTLAGPYYTSSEHVLPLLPPDGAPPGEVRAGCFETVVDEIDWVAGAVADAHTRFAWSEIAVLVRNRTEIPALTVAMRDSGVPVEVVGLTGLLAQPEVEDVIATLRVVDDVTANAALLRLLTGPRWLIGARDLALLGRRARDLVDRPDATRSDDLDAELERSVRGVDPTEILSLADAVDDPGGLAYSSQARERFRELSVLLRGLRRHIGESPVDLVRRTITALDLDVELAALPGTAARLALDNLAVLVDAVAEFVGNDPTSPLAAVLAYLDAEDDYNNGMDVASPSDSDSVKLLTVHKAKGLEWDAVFVPFMSEKVFPSELPRALWLTSAAALPGPMRGDADSQPVIAGWSNKAMDDYKADGRDEALMEETRLGYVSLTRARSMLVATGHHWGRTQKNARGPSAFLGVVRDWLAARGRAPEVWAPAPDGDDDNPMRAAHEVVTWPGDLDADLVSRRRDVADLVTRLLDEWASTDGDAVRPADHEPVQDPHLQSRLRELDEDIELLLTEARQARSDVVEVTVPAALSPTAILAIRDDPDAFARRLARPMPHRPSASARFGTRFHAWLEAHFDQQVLLGDAELPGRDETDIDDEAELAELIATFRTGPFGDRTPFAVEAGFALQLAGQHVRGRIDAVYETADGFEVIDWKTNRDADADPLQLAIYRLAWAEMHDLALSQVSAAFYYVRRGEVVRYAADADPAHGGLPARAGIEAVLAAAVAAPVALAATVRA